MKELVLMFIKKYLITFIAVLAFAVFAIMMVNLGDVYAVTKKTETLNELCMFAFNIVFGSFLFYKIIDIYKNNIPNLVSNNRMIRNLFVFIIPTILYLVSRLIFNIYMDNGVYGTYNLVLIYICIIYYLVLKEKDIVIHEYLTKIFINTLYLFLVYCVVIGGIGVLIYVYNVLFGLLDFKYIIDIYIFLTVTIGYLGYFIIIEKTDYQLNMFSKVLVKYIMMIMVLVGFVFFYIYLFSIIVSRKIPSNQVFVVCTVLFSVGLIVALMSNSFRDSKIYDSIINYLPVVFIPALILQIVSLFIRINLYGLTMTRYTGIFIIIFEILYIIVYIFKYENLKYLFIAGSLLVLIMCFLPFVNQYQFPKLYNNIFHKYKTINSLIIDSDTVI